MRRVRDRQSGVSLVEFVLVAPLLVLMAMGIVDLGRAIGMLINLEAAARAGAEYATVYPEQTAYVRHVVKGTLVPGVIHQTDVRYFCVISGTECHSSTSFNFFLCDTVCPGLAETWVEVSVTRDYAPNLLAGRTLALTGDAVFRIR